MRQFRVDVRQDHEAGVWYVEHSDVPGLATEADTFEHLLAKLEVMIPELIELNEPDGDDGETVDVPFELIAHASARIRLSSRA